MEYKLPSIKPATRPASVINHDEGKDYFLRWAQYIVHKWWLGEALCNPGGYSPYSDEPISVLRAYGRGKQSTRKYNEIVDKQVKTKDGTTYSLTNVSKRIPQVYPTMRERIIDRILEQNFSPHVVAIDDSSVERKNLAYYRDKVATSAFGREMVSATGFVPENTTDVAMSMSDQDVDVLQALGGYNLATEVALTEAVRASLDICKYHPSIARQVIEDLVDLGFAHVHVKHNHYTRIQEIEYLDAEYVIVPNSVYDDCRDRTWGGILRPMSIASLREDIRASGSEVNEEDMLEIASTYRLAMGNSDSGVISNDNFAGRVEHSSGYRYDPFKVMVVTCYFVAAEAENFIAGIHDSGSIVYQKVPNGTTLKDTSKAKGFRLDSKNIQNVYKVNYVLGTNYCYGYGTDDLIVRTGLPGSMSAMIPIISFRANRKSLTEACISAIDDLCAAVFKKRLIEAKMPVPPNVHVNLSALENVTQLGSLVLEPQDLLDIPTVAGYLFTSEGEFVDFSQGTPQRPIQELPNTSFDLLRTIQLSIQMALDELQRITGTNEITDGTANPTNVLTTTVEAYSSATNRALSFLYTANRSIQDQIHTHLGRRYQAIAASGGATLRWVPVRTDTVRIVQLTPQIAFGDYAIISKPALDRESQQLLIAAVQTYKNANMLDAADEMAVMNMILRGEYLKAQFYLASAVARKRKQDAQMAQQTAAAQAQAQGQAGIAMEQAKQQTAAMEGDIKKMLQDNEHMHNMELIQEKSRLGLPLTTTQN